MLVATNEGISAIDA